VDAEVSAVAASAADEAAGVRLPRSGSYVPLRSVLGLAAEAAALDRVATDSAEGLLTDVAVLLRAAEA